MTSKQLYLVFGLLTVIFCSGGNFVHANATPNDSSLKFNNDIQLHDPLIITSDDQLLNEANLEGWDGDGSKSNPYIIENYKFSDGFENPAVVEEIKHTIGYDRKKFNGFTTINLVLSNISSYVRIENNEFMYSVVISQSKNIDIHANTWINPWYPTNLFINSDIKLNEGPFIVHDNTFNGVNKLCGLGNETHDEFSPRFYIYGGGIVIQHNIFEMDTGCLPISQITFEATNLAGKVKSSNVTSNWFKTSDLAINYYTGHLLIYNNDFESGDYSIFDVANDQVTSLSISHNNFLISEIGHQGKQNYQKTISFITTTIYSPNLSSNYYSNWTSPDDNRDGIVDEPFLVSMALQWPKPLLDYAPSTTSFPGYHGKTDDNYDNLKVFALTIFLLGVSGYCGMYFYSRYIKKTPIFDGNLNKSTKIFIDELFHSQTVLYYTLVGQSRFLDKKAEEKIKDAVPRDLWSFKFLLHPTRLALMKLLYENLDLTSVDLKDILKLSWNELYSHAYSLEKKGYIVIEDKFVDDLKRQALSLSKQGIEEYKMLTDLLHLFLDNSVDYQAYIQVAQQRLEDAEADLYPES